MDEKASIQIHFNLQKEAEIDSIPENYKNATFPILNYPPTDYKWKIERKNNQILLTLEAKTAEGMACGLYGLLQEKLGFQFIHPRQTLLPNSLSFESFEGIKDWSARPAFHKRGFHLHTMHPLELTEQLMDANAPNALADIEAYILWLARNGQNYMEFNLLEGIDKKKWPAFTKKWVDFAHQHGLLVGIDLSLHMVQQKAFQLFQRSFSKRKQVETNLKFLSQIPWDVYDMEFSTTEFSSGNIQKKTALQLFITDLLTHTYHAKLMGRKHVVKREAEISKGKKSQMYRYSDAEKKLDQNRGVLMHTVMFYTCFEEKAPVYRNENLQHVYQELLRENQVRETWYYPESAYWITFDNSVPMTLLPYLKARLEDIQKMDSLQLLGHITFSSGWEWGYWLTDWSIARWSWNYQKESTPQEKRPLSYLLEVTQDTSAQHAFEQALELQQTYLKDKELMRYMCPSSVTDEFPEPYNLEFQPRPAFSYKYIRNKASLAQLDSIENHVITDLNHFADASENLVKKYIQQVKHPSERQQIVNEMATGLLLTALRARHKALTLSYLILMRKAELAITPSKSVSFIGKKIMEQAEKVRQEALMYVRSQENRYRYSLHELAGKHKSHTAYAFGYLFPVHDLHFWKREQEQALHNNWSPFYRNIFDLLKIIGLKN